MNKNKSFRKKYKRDSIYELHNNDDDDHYRKIISNSEKNNFRRQKSQK